MKHAENFAPTLPLSIQFIPLGASVSVCGNCSNWKGPRERNGRKCFICLDGSKGACQQKLREYPFDGTTGSLTSPVAGTGCPHWKFAA